MTHDEVDSDERIRARGPGRADRGRLARTCDARAHHAATCAGTEPSAEGGDSVLAFASSELFSGPVASPRALREYEAVVNGSARQLIDCHLRSEAVSADAVERLSRAEATAVTVGVIGSQVLTLGALGAGVALVAGGHTAAAIAAVAPGVLSAAAQVVAAVRQRRP